MNTDVVKRLELHQQFVTSHGAPERLGEFLEMKGLDFRGIPLERARLDEVIVPSSDFTGARMAGADMFAGNFADCKFIGADLSAVNLNKSTLVYADFTRAVLRGAELRRADLSNAVLRGAVLDGADLSRVDLDDADLRGASLCGCTLDLVVFDRVRVAGADLRGAKGFWAEREHQIDVGGGEAPEMLTGQAACEWLLRHIHSEAVTAA